MTYNNKPFVDLFFKDVYPLYVQKYSYLKKLSQHIHILEVKIQKTKIGEGYHTVALRKCRDESKKPNNGFYGYILNDVDRRWRNRIFISKV